MIVQQPIHLSNTQPKEKSAELVALLSRRASRLVAESTMDGNAPTADALIKVLGLHRKRPTLALQVLGWVCGSLQADGLLPMSFAVTQPRVGLKHHGYQAKRMAA